jgi:glycosyltransferase involved in cell wall biosynthesis
MRIGVDVRCLTEGRRTGVEEYTINLLKEVFRLNAQNEYKLFLNSWKKSQADLSWIQEFPNVKIHQFKIPNKILNLCFWYLDWPKIDRMLGGVDVFFMPNLTFYALSRKVKLIITLHDLSFERYPEAFSLKRRLWHYLVRPKRICERAERIIAVSQSTKNDLVNLYKIDPKKISVIFSGISDKFKIIDRNDKKLIAIKEKYQLPYRFILYLGTIEPRKNIVSLIRAFNQFKNQAQKENNEELSKYKLVIAGQNGWMMKKILEEIKVSPFKEDILKINFIEEKDKEYFYNLAALFIYPSFFEGFGFPPLEAMRCGVPVIASHSSSLPEVVAGGGILVDPNRPSEIATAMREILTAKYLRENLIQKGLAQAQKFTWQKSAKKFITYFNIC